MKPVPRSPAELSDALAAIFPSLPRDFGSAGESVLADAYPTFHSVLREFAYFFSKDLRQFSDRQLRRFADLVARSTASKGALGNAFDTAFLAHADPMGIDSRFRPFLSAAMKKAP